jgi:hypothetical protein
VCVEVLKQSKKRIILEAKMKTFFDWLLLAGMAATALFAAVGDWLPVIQTRVSALRTMAVAGGSVDWAMVGGVIFLVVVLVLYFKTSTATTGSADSVAVDYSVPRFVRVRVIE